MSEMLNDKQRVQMIIEAIKSVRRLARQAQEDKNTLDYNNYMLDLISLENCLVTEVERFIN